MMYTTVKPLTEFEFWSGAKDTASKFTYNEMLILDDYLSELDGITLTETEVNDIFWFDVEMLCEVIGITEEELFNR